jgi:hypothetical protein
MEGRSSVAKEGLIVMIVIEPITMKGELYFEKGGIFHPSVHYIGDSRICGGLLRCMLRSCSCGPGAWKERLLQ